jgi:integrase
VRGNLTKRGKNSWRYKVVMGGRTHLATLRGTRKQAEQEATKILADLDVGCHVPAQTESVSGFITRWLTTWASDNVSNKTFERYESLLAHIARRVGHLPIQKLSAADLQAVYAGMAKAGLSDQTRLHVHRVTGRMLAHAVQWGVIARNVAAMVDAPRVVGRELEILSPAQIKTVLETLRGLPLHTIATVLLGTGLRRSELLAQRWQDIDLDGGTLRVEQALEETQRGGRQFKAPKNKHSRRTVTLPPSIVSLLRATAPPCRSKP